MLGSGGGEAEVARAVVHVERCGAGRLIAVVREVAAPVALRQLGEPGRRERLQAVAGGDNVTEVGPVPRLRDLHP
jgi:hypothetical protein